jgi:hypothetical protein
MLATLALAVLAPSNGEYRLDSPPVTVSFSAQRSIFPAHWQRGEVKAAATPIAANREIDCVNAISRAVSSYSPALTEKNLKTVYIAGSLRFYGLDYGGTNSEVNIYLTYVDAKGGKNFLERAFHHEFSSILLRNYSRYFPYAEWQAALPDDFVYRGDGTQSLREGTASTRYDTKFHDNGFLAEYATSSLEEDFNMVAEALFAQDQRLWNLYNDYPMVKKKVDLVIQFYQRIDPKIAITRFISQAPRAQSGTM